MNEYMSEAFYCIFSVSFLGFHLQGQNVAKPEPHPSIHPMLRSEAALLFFLCKFAALDLELCSRRYAEKKRKEGPFS
jgi:hypothetical protein